MIRDDEEICVKCYQDEVLESGHDVEDFEHIPGDFFNDSDLEKHGWIRVPRFGNFHIAGSHEVKVFRDTARGLIKAGKKVLVNYDAMGIGGSDGYVSLFQKAV
jgi:hypothetical protein